MQIAPGLIELDREFGQDQQLITKFLYSKKLANHPGSLFRSGRQTGSYIANPQPGLLSIPTFRRIVFRTVIATNETTGDESCFIHGLFSTSCLQDVLKDLARFETFS
jgi:hypothetical protein